MTNPAPSTAPRVHRAWWSRLAAYAGLTSDDAVSDPDARPQASVPARAAEAVRQWSPGTWLLVDRVVAVVSFLALTTPALLGVPSSDGHPLAAVALGAGSTLPIAWRRRWPVGVLVVITASVVASLLLGVRTTPLVSNLGPGVALAVYTVVSRASRPEQGWWAVGLTCIAASAATTAAFSLHPEQDHNAVHAMGALGAWLVGETVRTQRAYRADLAARRRAEEAERARRAVAEERLRISREVHDVVSHSLSVIAVRSGVGRMVAESQPGEAQAALAAIETASRGALDELRRLLATIRDPEADPAPEAGDRSPLAPVPRVADLPALVERLAGTGVEVSLRQSGTVRPVPPMLELTAYRIVQEALTNVARHAGQVPARVTVAYGPEALDVEVEDDGPAASPPTPTPGPGLGLPGMRDRAALFGGTVTAGPRPEGGFRVHAHLPATADPTPGGGAPGAAPPVPGLSPQAGAPADPEPGGDASDVGPVPADRPAPDPSSPADAPADPAADARR